MQYFYADSFVIEQALFFAAGRRNVFNPGDLLAIGMSFH